MPDSPTVWFVQKPHAGKDLSSAEKFGRLRFIFQDPGYQPSFTPRSAYAELRAAMREFNPETDYLVFAGGDPIGCLMAGQVFQEFYGDSYYLNTLRWDRNKHSDGPGFYVETELEDTE